jgi:hypothetical protein
MLFLCRSRRCESARRAICACAPCSRPILFFGNRLDFSPKSEASSAPSRLDAQGRIAIVTTRGAGMRWAYWRRARFIRADERRRCGRKSCGPGLPTLRPSCADTIRAAMGATRPGPQGEHDISVKTIAQGMPDDRLNLWFLPRAFFTARGPWVRPSPGIPCALISGGPRMMHDSGAIAPRGHQCTLQSATSLRATCPPTCPPKPNGRRRKLNGRRRKLNGRRRKQSRRSPRRHSGLLRR